MMFRLEIEVGHDATTYYEDIADLLIKVASKMSDGRTDGRLIDRNGNIVGRFEFTMEDEE